MFQVGSAERFGLSYRGSPITLWQRDGLLTVEERYNGPFADYTLAGQPHEDKVLSQIAQVMLVSIRSREVHSWIRRCSEPAMLVPLQWDRGFHRATELERLGFLRVLEMIAALDGDRTIPDMLLFARASAGGEGLLISAVSSSVKIDFGTEVVSGTARRAEPFVLMGQLIEFRRRSSNLTIPLSLEAMRVPEKGRPSVGEELFADLLEDPGVF